MCVVEIQKIFFLDIYNIFIDMKTQISQNWPVKVHFWRGDGDVCDENCVVDTSFLRSCQKSAQRKRASNKANERSDTNFQKVNYGIMEVFLNTT